MEFPDWIGSNLEEEEIWMPILLRHLGFLCHHGNLVVGPNG